MFFFCSGCCFLPFYRVSFISKEPIFDVSTKLALVKLYTVETSYSLLNYRIDLNNWRRILKDKKESTVSDVVLFCYFIAIIARSNAITA